MSQSASSIQCWLANSGLNVAVGWRNVQKPISKVEYTVEFPDEESGNEDPSHAQLNSNEENILALKMGEGMNLKRKASGREKNDGVDVRGDRRT